MTTSSTYSSTPPKNSLLHYPVQAGLAIYHGAQQVEAGRQRGQAGHGYVLRFGGSHLLLVQHAAIGREQGKGGRTGGQPHGQVLVKYAREHLHGGRAGAHRHHR